MRYLLDTNVVSEMRKGTRADSGVRQWFAEVRSEDLALSVLALGEIRLGIHRIEKRDPQSALHLSIWLAALQENHEGRILPVDSKVSEAWALLNSVRSLATIDSLQVATALVHGLAFVTRNVGDVEGTGVEIVNPFNG